MAQTGILTIGNTEWDGSLGEAEQNALRMVGFLFKGYKVDRLPPFALLPTALLVHEFLLFCPLRGR